MSSLLCNTCVRPVKQSEATRFSVLFVMSRVTKRKHVTKEVLEELVEPLGDQLIVKILGGRGNNLHEAETPDGRMFLVSMPKKFRRNVWIKRGDFVIVEPITEGNKVQAEIIHILYPMQIKYLRDENKWPLSFQDKKGQDHSSVLNGDKTRDRSDIEITRSDSDQEPESEDESDLFINTNRPPPIYEPDTSSSEED